MAEVSQQGGQGARIRIALLAIGAGLLILGLKFYAYAVTGSSALKSDATESVVNVVSAVFAFGAVVFANRPADEGHPYGHGKIEHFSAAFEGGMISLAAVIIIYEAIHAMVMGPQIRNLGFGMLWNLGAGCLNGLLGLLLVRVGTRQNSQALMADGHHVLSDFYTTLGIGLGLLLVKLTGLEILDPLMALAVGLLLAFTGFRLVRESSAALLDAEDPALVEKLVTTINEVRPPEVLAIHEMRTLRAGRYTHVDIHVVIPEFLTVAQGHELVERFNALVLDRIGVEGELHTHTDPCQRNHCAACPMDPCPIRLEPQRVQLHITAPEAVARGPI